MATFFVPTDSGFTAEQRADTLLDYGLDWADALAAGDTITGSEWLTEPGAPLVLSNKQSSATVTSLNIEIPSGTPAGWYALENKITTTNGLRDSRACLLYVKPPISGGSALFPSRLVAIAKMRRDRLVLLTQSVMPGLVLSDDFLWDKLLAAEAEIAHTLRVPLTPTRFFPTTPSDAQIAALPAGMPWAIDPAYDYNPTDWYGDKWGLILTRQKPIQSVVSMRFVYPSPAQTIVEVPADWIRYDGKYGQLQLVPTGTQYQTLLGGLFMSQLSGGRTLPFTINLEYIAGLANVQRDYPDLIDAVYKLASTKIVEDAFLPQSGSISADGLSQSMSVDVSKYHEAVDRVLHGSGSNGGLMAKIHGIRVMAM